MVSGDTVRLFDRQTHKFQAVDVPVPARDISAARVLGDEGHLSNQQAAGLVREVLRASTPGRLKHLVLLHLSRQCNQPSLAEEAARSVLRELAPQVEVHVASQHSAGASLLLGGSSARGTGRRRSSARRSSRNIIDQAWLPGLES